jgi:hypothetical protein
VCGGVIAGVGAQEIKETGSPSTSISLAFHTSHQYSFPLLFKTANTDAIAFYERLGFEKGATVPGYYRKLHPPDAVILERRLR